MSCHVVHWFGLYVCGDVCPDFGTLSISVGLQLAVCITAFSVIVIATIYFCTECTVFSVPA